VRTIIEELVSKWLVHNSLPRTHIAAQPKLLSIKICELNTTKVIFVTVKSPSTERLPIMCTLEIMAKEVIVDLGQLERVLKQRYSACAYILA
jgi:hypothetical protein